MTTALPVLLTGLAVGVAVRGRPSTSGRLRAVLPTRRRPSPSDRARLGRRVSAPVLACAVAGLALAALFGWAGLAAGVLLTLGGPRALARLEPRAVRADRERMADELPLALDLLAACLAGGGALPEAVRAVADALPGPSGQRLARIAGALSVGSSPGEAWSALDSGPEDPLGAAAARTLARAGEGGAPVAAAVARLADEARQQARARGEQAAHRAGVLAVAPLGLCFLPAFVLLGVVPVIAGLIGPLLATF